MRRRASEFVDDGLQAGPAEYVTVLAEAAEADGAGKALSVGVEDEVEKLGAEGKVAFAVQDVVDELRGMLKPNEAVTEFGGDVQKEVLLEWRFDDAAIRMMCFEWLDSTG